MSKKKAGPLFGIGGTLLLTVLLVLCLTMFAVLALSAAEADWRLSDKNAQAVSAYYEADAQAVRLMADAAALWPEGGQRPSPNDVLAALNRDYELDVVEQVDARQEQGLTFYGGISVDGSRILRLELYLEPPSQSERWKIRQWQLMPAPSDILREEPVLPVLQGE